ncbi:MAG TPA: hypothetical protein VKV26_11170 [Dehalococcoidia bacterium]|nr:hypothetical protein [Dehalococcoidia bacterium]
MFNGTRRWAVFGAVAGVVTLGAAVIGGVAMAQTGGGSGAAAQASPTPAAGAQRKAQMSQRVDQFLNDLAANLHIDRATLDSALKTTANQEIDKAVQSGQLTQAEGDQAKQAIANGQFPIGIGGFERAGARGAMTALQGCQTQIQQAVQSVTGETPDQIRSDLQSGKKLSDILSAKGKTEQDLRNAVGDAVQSCLSSAVSAGTITQQQATDIVNGIKNGRGPLPFGGFAFRGPRGGHGARPNATATPAAQ